VTITQLPSTSEAPHSVSYSETSSYLLCKRKWEYGYGRSLKRVSESFSLMLGSALHTLLEAFYNSILDEGDTLAEQTSPEAWDRALAAAEARYAELLKDGFEDRDNKASLREIVFDFYLNKDLDLEPFVLKGWRILAVEKEFVLDTDMGDGKLIRTPIVVDLIVLDPTGKTVVVDHKGLQDFYNVDAASLQPQIPLYIAVLRGLGYKIDYGMYNMLRNRKIVGTKSKEFPNGKGATPEQRWSYLELKPNSARVRRSFMEQLSVAEEVIALSTLSEEERDLKMHRVANKMVCQSCSFKDLCTMELTGGNVPLLLRTEFTIRERKKFDAESKYGDTGEDE
jgi:hypothetical protein